MIHFRKSKNYMNIAKMNFNDKTDDINGLFEIDESKQELEEDSNQPSSSLP
jgi:hypothetical protein